jgi:hypothetical protein
MQPTLLTEIPFRLDAPDASRCTECKLPKKPRAKRRKSSRRR